MIAGDSAACATLPAPWGPIHVAALAGALVALELMTPGAIFRASLERRLRRPAVPAAEGSAEDRRLLDEAAEEVREYLAGARASFELPLALVGSTDWDRAVLAGVSTIPYGRVTSYGRLARLIGRPGAARAAGGAVGRNPIGLVIPCHRVIAGDGSLGGYGGDWFGTREQLLAVKRGLLELEGVTLPAVSFVG